MNSPASARPACRLEPHAEFGFLQVTPTPSAEEITRFYAEEFYSTQYGAFNNSTLEVQLRDATWHEAHWRDLGAAIVAASGRPLAGQRVLDVGCGWGLALATLRDAGAQCAGFDPAPEAVEYARGRGLDVRCAGMDTMDVFGGTRFDAVMLLNVLEHLADPVAVLREIRDRVLVPGGVLLVEVPNEFNGFQTAGRDLHGLHDWWVAPPGHLNYFTAATLRRLFEGTGYRVAHCEAAFPLEMFLLFGDRYVGDPVLGREVHEKRMAFETNLRALGREDVLHRFYAALAQADLGRQVTVCGVVA